MKAYWNKENLLFLVFVVVMLLLLFFGRVLLPFHSSGDGVATTSQPSQNTSNSNTIRRENVLPGTEAWLIPDHEVASVEIQAYASTTSVQPRQSLTFYVSTQVEGMSYDIAIFRLGWYQGLGGRLMTSIPAQVGHNQGYYNPTTHQLIECGSCHIDYSLGLVQANWSPSYRLTIPSDWVTGLYLAKLIAANGKQTYVPFVVRGSTQALYIVSIPFTTDAAYNEWGGFSLYEDYIHTTPEHRAAKVSFDRPYAGGNGAAQILVDEVQAIHWLESQGYDLSYISDIDMKEQPTILFQHRALLSLGHDEYWSREMRQQVQQARDRGIGLAFLGADDVYWQVRFEPDKAGISDRTIVCYKVETDLDNLSRDPLYGKDNSLLTSQWRDPVLALPENALIGIMFAGRAEIDGAFPWQLKASARSPLLNGTNLVPAVSYGCGIVGKEWDRVFDNGATPPGLQILGESPVKGFNNVIDVGQTTYYIAPSGAMVFAAGSIDWANALDAYRFTKACSGQQLVIPGLRKLMANVIAALIVDHPSQTLATVSSPATMSTIFTSERNRQVPLHA